MRQTRSTCCYCGVGCGLIIESENQTITQVSGDPKHPANFGRLCTKGSTLHLTARDDMRAHYPEMRTQRSASRQRCSWDQALDRTADQFAKIIQTHGPDAVGFYISGQLLTEDYYVFNKLAKGLIGTNNVDTNSRLCMSSAVVGYKQTLGMDAPPACYEDIDHTQCLFISGSNTAYAHPIVFRRIEDARQANPDMKMIVVDPRATDTAKSADLHLPILPGTDVMLYNAMLHIMLWEGWCDMDYIANHTNGFDALKKQVRHCTPEQAAKVCGIPAADIVDAARWFAQGPTLSLYCQGLNQSSHGSDKNSALINLHLATGQIGKPGAAPFSLTGQPNAMGGREVGGMANLLSAHRNLANAADRAEVAQLWGIPSVPDQPGKTAVDMFEALRDGSIKAVWIACTNPAQSMPNLNLVTKALETAELVVVQEAFNNTDTVAYADVLLPASTWGEKSGTVTNSERRISRVNSAVPAPGEARDDWKIVVDFAERLAQRLNKTNIVDYHNSETIFNEHRATTVGRDLDIGGLSYQILEQQGPQQWPFPDGSSSGLSRLYEDGVFPTVDGKANFACVKYQGLAQTTSDAFPLHLNSGRLRDQWHGMSRTGSLARLYNHVEEPRLNMHPEDMRQRELNDNDIVTVSSPQGQLNVKVVRCDEMRSGQVFLAMHWGNQNMNGLGVNALTGSAFDPHSKQPELKHAPVQVKKLTLAWQMIAMAEGNAVKRMHQLQPLLAHFAYATLGLAGRDHEIVILRVAHQQTVAEEILQQVDQILELDDPEKLCHYQDNKRGISKRARVSFNKLHAVRLSGEIAAQQWLKDIMAEQSDITLLRPWLLAPVTTPPTGIKQRGKIVCNCLDVSEEEIKTALTQGLDLPGLQEALKCGTQCGSCLPELKQLVAQQRRD